MSQGRLGKVVVFGGSGFVGSKVLEVLVGRVEQLVGASRSGRPSHLQREAWAKDVKWLQCDALDPSQCAAAVEGADGVVVAIGSPPLPFVDYAFQVAANGTTNVNVVEAAEDCGKIVLVNATMPHWAPKGYRDGKLQAEAAAMRHKNATILKPSAIYGTRHHRGFPIPVPLAPISWLFQNTKPLCDKLNTFPIFHNVLVPPLHVDAVAHAAADALFTNHHVFEKGDEENDDDTRIDTTKSNNDGVVTVLDPFDILRHHHHHHHQGKGGE
mmetsp:Transcript_15617/g.51106  ORF Transcript_15617/g.51106 Transcript_15617/m.51106 type:complete len:269 (+) Transcript_15617:108-914(+)